MPDDDDEEIPDGGSQKTRAGNAIIAVFLRTPDADERDKLLVELKGVLPSWIRVYDDNGKLAVYADDRPTPIPKFLGFAAHYIEIVLPDGTARVRKGGAGPVQLAKSTEPRILSAWQRLAKGDDLL